MELAYLWPGNKNRSAFVTVSMKKSTLLFLFLALLLSCGKNRKIPDVSHIKVDIPVERFDQAFFAMDSSRPATSLRQLQQKFPGFYNDFMSQILGVNPSPEDPNSLEVTRSFFRGYQSIYDSVKTRYQDISWLKIELEKGFRFVKYYFPQYKTGRAWIFLGPFDAPGVATTATGIAIGLQQFAGRDFSIYSLPQMQEMFPAYISRRFDPAYITANSMKAVVQELFPDQSAGKPLVEQMVEKGKQWWLLDKFLPEAPDSVKTGYTALQLKWCSENEGLIWSEIVRNEDLNSLSPAVIQAYIGEGPFTQGFSQVYSPGNLGQWLGWRIVQKYVSKNPDIQPGDLMQIPARKILEEAKYKPR